MRFLISSLLLGAALFVSCGDRDDDEPKPCEITEAAGGEACPEDPKPNPEPNPTPSPEPEPQPGEEPSDGEQPKPTPNPQPSPGSCYKDSAENCDIEKRILDKTNAYRSQAGAPALTNSQELEFASGDWSQQQAAAGRISHDGFPQARNSAIKKEFPSSSVTASGENVAMFGYVNGGLQAVVDGRMLAHEPMSILDYEKFVADPEAVAKKFAEMWYNSEGHRRNMLDKNFKIAGMGVYPKNGGYYATQLFGR